MATRTLRVEVLGDARQFQRTVDNIERNTGRLAGGFGKLTTAIGVGFAALGGQAILGGIKGLVDEAREAERVGRITEARIRSTGGAANVSAKDIDRLTTSLSNKVGVDDDLIASGANLLLTFKGVRNEAGRNNDIFNQATKLSVDLAAGMHQGEVSASGLQSANIMLGKALENPIKGISALTRAGVSFTDQQKDQIKQLVESGRTLDAQRLILQAVGEQFAGTAEAASDPLSRLNTRIGNIKETIGQALLPAVDQAAAFIDEKLIPAAERWWGEHGPAVREAFSRIGHIIGVAWGRLKDELWPEILKGADYLREELLPEVDKLTQAWRDNSEAIGNLAEDLRPVTDTWLPVLKRLLEGTSEEIRGVITMLGWLGRAWEALKGPAVAVARFISNRILDVFGNILWGASRAFAWVPGLGPKLRSASENFDKFKQQVNRSLNQIDDERVNVVAHAGVSWTAEAGRFRATAGRVFARAGGGPIFGPGTATSDSIPAWLSTGEHVWSAREVRGAGGHEAMEAMRSQARGFADGGGVRPTVAFTGSIGQRGLQDTATGLAIGLGRNLGVALMKAMGQGRPGVQAFIRSVDPLPYIWGGAGPGGYDCSGLVSAVHLAHLGRAFGHGQRLYTTSSIHAGIAGLKSGLGGILQIGVTAGTGHMAGRYAGLGFEAESTRTGIKVGAAASRPESFARQFHLARGGRIDAEMVARFAALAGADIGGDFGRLRINGKVADHGAVLAPGLNLLDNRTGRPEPLVPAGRGGDIHVHLHGPVYGDRQALIREIRSGLKSQLDREGKPLARQL